MLELALWRIKINELAPSEGRHKKKMKVDQSAIRNQCRISCGANIVIEHVLPYLLPVGEEEGNGTGEDAGGAVDDEGDSSDDDIIFY